MNNQTYSRLDIHKYEEQGLRAWAIGIASAPFCIACGGRHVTYTTGQGTQQIEAYSHSTRLVMIVLSILSIIVVPIGVIMLGALIIKTLSDEPDAIKAIRTKMLPKPQPNPLQEEFAPKQIDKGTATPPEHFKVKVNGINPEKMPSELYFAVHSKTTVKQLKDAVLLLDQSQLHQSKKLLIGFSYHDPSSDNQRSVRMDDATLLKAYISSTNTTTPVITYCYCTRSPPGEGEGGLTS
jgi:hypothetical protein